MGISDILGDMTKRLVDVDDKVLASARRALGTTTLKDTVNTALQQAVDANAQHAITMEDIQAFADATPDLRNPEIMAKAWE